MSEATIQRMLALQESKLSLEVKQAEVALREVDHNQKLADKSIEAQVADRKDERLAHKQIHLHRLIFAAGIVAMLLAFVGIALYMNKDAMVLDIIKVVVGFVGGWGASYAWRGHRRNGNNNVD